VDPAILVTGVSKRFRLYHERNQSLKAMVMRRRRAEYEEFLALDDVSLQVRRGATFGFIGENGSGKSTLLKCVARILRPDRGEITTTGKVSALLELGAGFHPELSGRDNVYLNGSILGLSRRDVDRKFDDIVGFAGLERFIDTPVKSYSSGMYVRLGFSVAINVEPDILLVDEVLAVGDEQFQSRCAEKFRQLRDEGRTVVVVSHGLPQVRAMCDEVAWLSHGKVVQLGPAPMVVDAYTREMHAGREEGSGIGARWGTGEAVIDRIEVLGADGQPARQLRSGAPATIRLQYRVVTPNGVPGPRFRIAVHTLEGVHVAEPDTSGIELPPVLTGSGVVEFALERLPLLSGTYDLSARLTDDFGAVDYDVHQRTVRFDVDPSGDPGDGLGIVSLGGHWDVHVHILRAEAGL
jgi:ABC-2 type transport system ATP-binding protein